MDSTNFTITEIHLNLQNMFLSSVLKKQISFVYQKICIVHTHQIKKYNYLFIISRHCCVHKDTEPNRNSNIWRAMGSYMVPPILWHINHVTRMKSNLKFQSSFLLIKSFSPIAVTEPDWKVCTARAISCTHRKVCGFQPWPHSWQ